MIPESARFKIAAFYKFFPIDSEDLPVYRAKVKNAMRDRDIVGTVILAGEGLNSTICGRENDLDEFLADLSRLIAVDIEPKFSFSDTPCFRKVDVKIKPEIVTLKKKVDIEMGRGTHVSAKEWNDLLSDPNVVILDTRNDYEFKTGTFDRALNPGTEKFSDLPEYVAEHFHPAKHKKIAMFCTGGIRCEKFAPYMRSLGFEQVFQLKGGILKYLEEVPVDEQRWSGECYVFDTRVTVDKVLAPGTSPDRSQGE